MRAAIRPYGKAAEMNEAAWLASNDAHDMLLALQWLGDWSRALHERRLRLFACGCYRLAGGKVSPHDLVAVEVAERFAEHGDCWKEEMHAAAAGTATGCCMPDPEAASLYSAETSAIRYGVPRPSQAALARCVFGNPFRRQYGWLKTSGPHPGAYVVTGEAAPFPDRSVVTVAAEIYESRRWYELPVLADALEDAGCEDAGVLGHLRGPGPHARGCHVLDLILGRE